MTGGKRGAAPGRAGRWALWGGALAVLALPAVAMRFTSEVAWDASDFLAFGAMLLVACAACELAMAWIASRRGRRLAIALVGLVFVLVWMELAVGLLGPG